MLTLAQRTAQIRRAPRFYTVIFPALCAAYLCVLHLLGGLEAPHFLFVGLALFFTFFSDGTRRLSRVLLPYLLYVTVYDSMRWYADAIRSPVMHLREPYDFDKHFFGIRTAAGVLTPNEWLQLHTSAVLDFFCGLSYTPFFFVGESVALSIYLCLKHQDRRADRFTWVFVIANFVGFSLYYIYPAAPPWYVAAHGFTVDFSVRANPAGAIRFDQLVGYPLMQNFYGHSADVFGAIPSLHVVYPFLALAYSLRMPRFRWVALGYFLLVCFSAVYLNHHYFVDIFVGLGIALAVMAAFRLAFGPVELASPDEVPDGLATETIATQRS